MYQSLDCFDQCFMNKSNWIEKKVDDLGLKKANSII